MSVTVLLPRHGFTECTSRKPSVSRVGNADLDPAVGTFVIAAQNLAQVGAGLLDEVLGASAAQFDKACTARAVDDSGALHDIARHGKL